MSRDRVAMCVPVINAVVKESKSAINIILGLTLDLTSFDLLRSCVNGAI